MRSKHKLLLSGLLLFAIICSTVAVTLAYLSDKQEATNTFTIGDVQIELYPKPSAPNTPIQGGELSASSAYATDPKIVNVGPNDCFVKVEITVNDISLLPYIELSQSSNDWTQIDSTDFKTTGKATLYYNQVLPQKVDLYTYETPNIFDSIELTGDYLEGTAGSLDINLKATAIQTRYNGSNATNAQQAFSEFEEVHS